MCLIALSYHQHPQYPLIIAANRDEHYERPTRAARFWDDKPSILAGKDLQADGTWLGITKQGQWSALTNYRDPSIQRQNPPSRGKLPLNFLQNSQQPENYLTNVQAYSEQFMGFNLLAGSISQLGYYSNTMNEIQLLDPGLYALSNGLLDTPWPKVERAKSQLHKLVTEDKIAEEALFNLLQDEREAPDEQLPDTGIPKDIEKKVSPIFIKSDGYGTRCSTVILVSSKGEVQFTERRFEPGTQQVADENHYQFSINKHQCSS
jgi:uncharacterized protein with NRDE domain